MPGIVSVQCPANSCDAPCWPANQNTWQVTFPFSDPSRIGIGYIVEPSPFAKSWNPSDFAFHDHQYPSSQVPNPNRAQITFEFDTAVSVGQLWVIQHANGIIKIDGLVGSTLGNLAKFGSATSLLGDVGPTSGLFRDGAPDLFRFSSSGTGRIFRFVITKTPLANGFAVYRAYPRDASGNEIHIVPPPVPPVSPASALGPA
jgi:hypothetical protein